MLDGCSWLLEGDRIVKKLQSVLEWCDIIFLRDFSKYSDRYSHSDWFKQSKCCWTTTLHDMLCSVEDKQALMSTKILQGIRTMSA